MTEPLRVSLVSNIPHSVYLGQALASEGLLAQYLGPVVQDAQAPVRELPLPGTRRFNRVADLPLRWLWSAELARQVLDRTALPAGRRAIAHSAVLDRSAARRLAPADVVHWHTAGLLRTARRARSQGAAVLIADHRDVHPADHENRDPLLERIVQEFMVADHVVVNSDLAAESLEARGVPQHKLAVIPLGADLDLFKRDQSERTVPGGQAVLFVGSLTRRKGVDLLLEAAARPEFAAVRFVLAGPAVDPAITASARRLPNVDLLGPVGRGRLAELYRSVDVAVLPSRLDSFGLVIAEAVASGTPVVVSDGCGSATLVREHRCGLVIRSGSSAAVADALQRIISDPALRQSLRHGTRAATDAVSWAAYQRRVQSWYRQVVLPSVEALSHGGPPA